MGRPAALRFGLAILATGAACGGSKHDSAIGNSSRAGGGPDLTAAYLCSIEDGGYHYPQMPCVVKNVGGKYVLAKLAGSQRFRGEVRAAANGLSFDGEYYCPWGDCTQPMHGEFVRRAGGELVGKFDSVVVTMVPAPANVAWGGTSYGGDAYGGFGYGGWGYGGSEYGMQLAAPAPSPRSNRRH
ncbi:MAG TPA: hypothetical protein VMZ53_05860 [Kofleriaceae bacterium]|nr:hypothetical protein [Kofleriaceae bacterium]